MRPPFVILPSMFAIKRGGAPHLVIYPESGTRALQSPEALEAWAQIYARQSDEVRESAMSASMFGWHAPCALAALTAMNAAQEGQS